MIKWNSILVKTWYEVNWNLSGVIHQSHAGEEFVFLLPLTFSLGVDMRRVVDSGGPLEFCCFLPRCLHLTQKSSSRKQRKYLDNNEQRESIILWMFLIVHRKNTIEVLGENIRSHNILVLRQWIRIWLMDFSIWLLMSNLSALNNPKVKTFVQLAFQGEKRGCLMFLLRCCSILRNPRWAEFLIWTCCIKGVDIFLINVMWLAKEIVQHILLHCYVVRHL